MSDSKCPHCQHDIGVEMIAKLAAKSEVTLTLNPEPGELMNSATIGGMIADVGKLLRISGEAMSVPTEVLVKRISTADDGAVSITLVVARYDEAKRLKERRRKAKSA